MKVGGPGANRQLEGDHAAQADRRARQVRGDEGPVGVQHHIGGEQLRVLGNEGLELVGTQLLLTLDQDLDVAGQATAGAKCRLETAECREERALHVGGTAGVDRAITNVRAERWCCPLVFRGDRLDIVVSVDQHCRSVDTGTQPLAVNHWVHCGLHEAYAAEADPPEVVTQPLSGGLELTSPLRLGTDGADLEKLTELSQVTITVLDKVPIDNTHLCLDRGVESADGIFPSYQGVNDTGDPS